MSEWLILLQCYVWQLWTKVNRYCEVEVNRLFPRQVVNFSTLTQLFYLESTLAPFGPFG